MLFIFTVLSNVQMIDSVVTTFTNSNKCVTTISASNTEVSKINYVEERRGVGGTFIENLHDRPYREVFDQIKSNGESFLESYVPIIK